MSPHDTALDRNEYRLVLVKSGSNAICGERRGHTLCLPRIAIPRWTRPVEQLQEGVKAAWHLRTIVLDVLPGKNGHVPCAIMEVLSSGSQRSLATANINEITEEEMTCEEREVVKAILAGDTGIRGPFSRVGWIKDAMEWICAEVGHDIAFTGEVSQYNAAASFALIHLATKAGPTYWLKATGEPNAHEFHITRLLSELCPEFLPQRVAERSDWNAWLMEDAGQPVDDWTLPTLEQAVSSMAELQKRTIGRTGPFLDAGAFDQRLHLLRAHLTELVEYLDETMKKQSSTKAPRVEKRRLQEMASVLQDVCFRMEALDIPDTLVHNDINFGNILFKDSRCVFTDWCEAGVGNPFFAFQYLCLLQSRCGEDRRPYLKDIYKGFWFDTLSTHQIEQAFILVPPLAVLSYFYGGGKWLNSPQRNNPEVESHARSLARHIDRAIQDSELLEAICH